MHSSITLIGHSESNRHTHCQTPSFGSPIVITCLYGASPSKDSFRLAVSATSSAWDSSC